MRTDPDRLASRSSPATARRGPGVLNTPARRRSRRPRFVPLATRGSVKGLLADEVAGLGYEMVLGNTYHLMLAPGGERIAELGGLHEFMGWDRRDHHRFRRFPGLFARPRRGRRRGQGPPRAAAARGRRARRSTRRGSASAPTSTATSSSSRRSARWRCRRRSAPTSRSSSTSARRSAPTATTPPARPSAPIAGSTAASTWHGEHGPAGQAVFGIVQGGIHEDLRRESARGRRRGRGRRDRDRRHARPRQGADARGARHDRRPRSPADAAQAPARDRRARRPRRGDRPRHRQLRLRGADPARPPRHGAGARCPRSASAIDVRKRSNERRARPARRGLPLPRLHPPRRAPTSTTCRGRRS